MPTATPPPAVTPAPGEILVVTGCWSCGLAVYKTVRRQRQRRQHLTWQCTECDVSWSATGSEVADPS